MKNKKYYLGLDVGTNSVGYAVTDTDYHLLKFRGEPMWGSHIFEEGSQCAERRGFRTGRRRLDRRQQRVRLVQEIFAKEVAKIDDRFFIRLKESALYREDLEGREDHILFCDEDYTDIRFFANYPTIHHLIVSLMEDQKTHDIREVYLAAAWLVAHRGHFLSEVDKEKVEEVLDFASVYEVFLQYYRENSYAMPWECENVREFQDILLMKKGTRVKEKEFQELLYGGKKKKEEKEDTVISANAVIKLLSGGTVAMGDLFCQQTYEEKTSISLKKSQEEFESMLADYEEEADFLIRLRNVYDWSLLYEASGGNTFLSKTKVQVYEQHKKDLRGLKDFVRKYLPNRYHEVFRSVKGGLDNYVSYSHNTSGVKRIVPPEFKKCNKEAFCSYIRNLVKNVECDEEDRAFYKDMMERLECDKFMPKQVDGDNRVIPYQLYYHELKTVLQRAEVYLPFLSEKDADGYTNKEKLLAIMEYRIPYYVGPLHKGNDANAWIIRRADAKGLIRPWNFEKQVDLEASEKEFIRRMTNACTYLPGETVMPKNALLYCQFMVLNEINNIRVNGAPISVECKQGIYNLFVENRKVSVKRIRDYLISNNYMEKEDEISGLDITVKSSLSSYHDFKRLLSSGALQQKDVERIIEQITYSEEKLRVKKWLDKEFPNLPEEDRKYISKLKYKDFGRLSEKFLTGFCGTVRETAERPRSIIRILWETNDNLMQILYSDRYDFQELLKAIREDYYREQPANTEKLLEDMWVSNAVKRSIYRTLDIVKDVRKACSGSPEKIFIEMARGGGVKGKRTDSRRKQIERLYQVCNPEEVRELSKELEGRSDNELQSEVLFLYFMQLGRCMYSGDPIDIQRLKIDTYVNIDHIYPQAYVKDDSLDNKVLVFSDLNGKKGDHYPIDPKIRSDRMDLWNKYKSCGLISKEKYDRLVRNTRFSDEEKQGFINRQLVETRQSTKALAELLKRMFPDAEIVYVKAGLVSDFRKEYDIKKSRRINDLHHAKDAYLNIVCGNVYHSKFTSRFFSLNSQYSLKTKTIFGHEVKAGDAVVWRGEKSIAEVQRILEKNHIHYTRYAFCRKGGLFDQQPKRKGKELVPRKAGLDPIKYGGYQKTTASFFLLVKYVLNGKKPKTDMMIVPVELMVADRVLRDANFAAEYVQVQIAQITGKDKDKIGEISFPLGSRPIKINTRFSFDGFASCVTKKSSGGSALGFTSLMPLMVDGTKEKYIRSLERFAEKRQANAGIRVDEEYDGISQVKNEELYQFFLNKLGTRPYGIIFGGQRSVLQNGYETFIKLSVEEQVVVLLNVLDLFKTGRAGGCDLYKIGGAPKAAEYKNSTTVSNWKKHFSDVRIIDESASGLYCSSSKNILEFL